MQTIRLGDIEIDVEFKDIKNVHLSVHPPTGKVRVSAPERMTLDKIRVYAISKLQWIKKQQKHLRSQLRETPRDYITRESHYFKGQRYLLKIIEHDAPPKVVLKHEEIELYVRPGTATGKRAEIMNDWYRSEMKKIIPAMLAKWEKKIGVKASEFGIRRMRTKWGTCNTEAKRIWFNLELAKKPVECLEYILVHELMHLLERRHNDRFVNLMDKHLPNWRHLRDELNRLPFSHVDWGY